MPLVSSSQSLPWLTFFVYPSHKRQSNRHLLMWVQQKPLQVNADVNFIMIDKRGSVHVLSLSLILHTYSPMCDTSKFNTVVTSGANSRVKKLSISSVVLSISWVVVIRLGTFSWPTRNPSTNKEEVQFLESVVKPKWWRNSSSLLVRIKTSG